VKDGKIKSIEEIYLFSLPIKEYQIIDILLPKLKGALYMNGDRTNERGVLTRFPRIAQTRS
jgi:small subunit ribosomal protein S2e